MIRAESGAAAILGQPGLVVVRQLEMMNVFLGFEEANRYALHATTGERVGWLVEEQGGFGSSLRRQFLRTHRPFTCFVMDLDGTVVLRFFRPFSCVSSARWRL